MNLSNRLTFSLVFSVLLVAGFVILPSVMAEEGGPTATFTASAVTLTDNPNTTDVDESTLSNISGDYILLVNADRNGLADPDNAGLFEVLVTFNRDVYSGADADGQAGDNAFGENDLATTDFTATVYKISDGMEVTSGVTIGAVSRVEIADTDPQEYEKRKFLVVVNVDAGASGDAPLAIRLALTADAGVFSKATPAGLDNNNQIQLEVPGVNNQESVGNFNVLPKPLIRPAVSVSASKIGLHQTVMLTLRFAEKPTGDDRPSRQNIKVTKGSILGDDLDTEGDDGLYSNDDGNVWTVVIIPQPGIGRLFKIKVEAISGAPFVLLQEITVDSTPISQRIDITGPANDRGPKGGGSFMVTVTYTVAPSDPLTLDGVSVTGGTKGSFNKSTDTVYTLTVDPTDPDPGVTGTLTVSVGQYSQDFSIPGIDVEDTPDDPEVPSVDPDAPTSITLSSGMDARGYLVVAPMGAVTDGEATSGLPSDVTPEPEIVSLPDLEEILYGGGTIDVYVKKDSDRPDVIVNEVMWAVDENKVGVEGYLTHQWIELYNNSDNAAPGGSITLWLKPRAFSGAPSDKGGRTDRLSNVLRFGTTTGWQLGTNHGQNGNSSEAALKEFISMYRASNKRGGDDGINGANWKQSTLLSHVNHRGTPGRENTRSVVPVSTRPKPASFTPPKSDVLINEVYNDSNNDLDWLELRFRKRTNIREWTLSYAKSDFSESVIMKFPDRDLWFDAGTILLIVNKGPQDTKLAAGQDYALSSANQARGAGPHKYWNPSNGNSSSSHYLDIPDYRGGDFLLILRTKDGNDRLGSRSRIHDVVGPGTFVRQTLEANTVVYEPHTRSSSAGRPNGYIWDTRVWPLNGQNVRDYDRYRDSLLQNDRKFAVSKVLARSGERDGWKKDGIYFPGNRGGLGYDRGVVADGTPGYDNGILKGKHTDLANGKVIVSEIMLTTDGGRYPQWIELHNTSKTNTVDLQGDTDGSNRGREGWSIRVENHFSDSWRDRRKDKLHVEVKFKDLGVRFIPPDQTILITADKVRNSGTSTSNHFPDHRVASIWGTSAKGAFKMSSRRDIFLNVKGGFLLEIVDGSNQVSDVVGNLDGVKPDIFNEAGFDDPYSWNWPTDMVGNRRTSLIRKYDDRVPRPGTPDRNVEGSMRGAPAPLGTAVGDGEKGMMYSWVHASDTKTARAQITWYGSDGDYGTPGHTSSTPLPVSLSYFRPTLENGEVVIRWTTESELDNAGFNILRSDSRNGEFKQVNSELVQGAGTTGERNTYKWVDESAKPAKPGVIYYYQIEDVSFAGERQTLTTTKLKGLISADNKLTTLWGGLKSQD